MRNLDVLEFVARQVGPPVVAGARVLEVGSQAIGGSSRPLIERYSQSYLGVDIAEGEGVDRLVPVEELRSIAMYSIIYRRRRSDLDRSEREIHVLGGVRAMQSGTMFAIGRWSERVRRVIPRPVKDRLKRLRRRPSP